jgi:uroporphyrinogen-III synthase
VRKLLLLRPEPGLSASAERARKLGLEVIACPLFQVEPVAWQAPELSDYDALLLTSANAVRLGGPELNKLMGLPVHAVGEATAASAREAGFHVATIGEATALELLAGLPGSLRLLHVAGEDHRDIGERPIERRIAYRSRAIEEPGLPPLQDLVVAVHSPRSGKRLGAIARVREATSIAAISTAAADACGGGWEQVEVAERPNDNSLLALAARLCQTSSPQ